MDLLVVAAFLLVAALEILVPLGIAFWLSRRTGISKKVFAYGAAFFVLVQVFHIPLIQFTQVPFAEFLRGMGLEQPFLLLVFSAYAGLLAGLFEEIGRCLVFVKFFPRKKIKPDRKNAVMLGLGWGGIESIAVAVLVAFALLAYLSAAPLTAGQISDINAAYGGSLTAEEVQSMQEQIEQLMNLNPLHVLLGLAERLMAITLHVAWTLMVLTAVLQRKKLWLFLAVLWHSAVDAVAVFVATNYGAVQAELAVFVFFLLGVFYIYFKWKGE